MRLHNVGGLSKSDEESIGFGPRRASYMRLRNVGGLSKSDEESIGFGPRRASYNGYRRTSQVRRRI